MAKRQAKDPGAGKAAKAPHVFKATLGPLGRVIKAGALSKTDAVAERRAGRNVVVCGEDHAANRALAREIELQANGSCKRCPPHPNGGPDALPHYQPNPRLPEGHTFYETDKRKARAK